MADAVNEERLKHKFNLKKNKPQVSVLSREEADVNSMVAMSYGGSAKQFRRNSVSSMIKGMADLKSNDNNSTRGRKKSLREYSLEQKLESYSALKRKYTGADCLMGKLAKEEAIKIQEQRKRINELKGEFASSNKRALAGDEDQYRNRPS